MKEILPIIDVQCQSNQIVDEPSESAEDALDKRDEWEMLRLIELGMEDFRMDRILSQAEVRARLEKRSELL